MAVPEDNGVGAGEATAHARQAARGGAGIVDDREGLPAELELKLRRQSAPQIRLVDVSVDGVHDRAERPQLIQHRGGEEIAGMDDRIGSAQELDTALGQAPFALGHVGVGDDRDHEGRF